MMTNEQLYIYIKSLADALENGIREAELLVPESVERPLTTAHKSGLFVVGCLVYGCEQPDHLYEVVGQYAFLQPFDTLLEQLRESLEVLKPKD